MIVKTAVFLVMLAASVEDYRKKEISGIFIGLTGAISLAFCIAGLLNGKIGLREILMSLLPGLFLIFMAWVSREQIGCGDGLLLVAAGPAIGVGAAFAGTAAAFFLSGIVSVILMAIKRVGKRYTLPFVPFLAFGIGVSIFAKI